MAAESVVLANPVHLAVCFSGIALESVRLWFGQKCAMFVGWQQLQSASWIGSRKLSGHWRRAWRGAGSQQEWAVIAIRK